MDDDNLTTGDVADILGVNGETIRRWAASKKIRHTRLPSGQLRFKREDLGPWMEPVEPEAASA